MPQPRSRDSWRSLLQDPWIHLKGFFSSAKRSGAPRRPLLTPSSKTSVIVGAEGRRSGQNSFRSDDDRLPPLKEHLPTSYTTIHQVHCLTDEELKEALDSGALHPKVSQGVLARWLKEYRFQGSTGTVPTEFRPISTVLGPPDLDPEHLNRFKDDLDKLATTYGFKVVHEEENSSVALRQRRNKDRSNVMVGTLRRIFGALGTVLQRN